ncbi:MAG: hypothetical protein HFF69_08785 [Oscillospiraceae bacterium]|nr:hypothetical protein [Oscillospiraceae bacterium]
MAVFPGGDGPRNKQSQTGGIAVHSLLYALVDWAADGTGVLIAAQEILEKASEEGYDRPNT